jgi:hypothetical protein
MRRTSTPQWPRAWPRRWWTACASRRVLETLAEGCEQLAAMPDPVGEITELKRRPSGIQVGRCACRWACSA